MDTTLVEFVGELDVWREAEIAEALEAAVHSELVEVSISRVPCVGSTLLNALVKLRRHRLDAGLSRPILVFGANVLARRVLALTGLDALFNVRPAGEMPDRASRRIVRGEATEPLTVDDFLDSLDRMVQMNYGITSRDESDGVRRWVHLPRQVQAHCVSEAEMVLLNMHHVEADQWSVDDVRQVRIDQASPWALARAICEYVLCDAEVEHDAIH